MLSLADSFLAGAILSLVLPLALLIAIGAWYTLGLTKIPEPDPENTLVGEPPATEQEPPSA
jgi:hypothetical protein